MGNPHDSGRVAPRFLPTLTPCNAAVHRCPVSRSQAEKRILFVRTGANGDILMSTPVLRALRQAYPTAHITWMIEHTNTESIDANPFVDEIIWRDGEWLRRPRIRQNPLRRGWRIFYLLARLITRNRGGFDLLISYQPEQWAFFPKAFRRAVKIGVFDTWRNIEGADESPPNCRFYDAVFTHEQLPEHRTSQALLPLQPLKISDPTDKSLIMGFTQADSEEARAFLSENGTEVDGSTSWSRR